MCDWYYFFFIYWWNSPVKLSGQAWKVLEWALVPYIIQNSFPCHPNCWFIRITLLILFSYFPIVCSGYLKKMTPLWGLILVFYFLSLWFYRHTSSYCASLCCTSQMCFYKLKARPFTSTTITTCFIVRLTWLQWCGTKPQYCWGRPALTNLCWGLSFLAIFSMKLHYVLLILSIILNFLIF